MTTRPPPAVRGDPLDRQRALLRARLDRRPGILPALMLFVLGTTLALVAPVPVAVLVGAVAILAIWIARGAAATAKPSLLLLSVVAASLILHPIILHFGVGLPLDESMDIAIPIAIRLGGVLLVAAALDAWVRPGDWLAGLRRWPRVALVIMLTFRLVPEFAAMQRRVRRAQDARGLTTWHDRARGIITAFTLVLERAERMSRSL